MGPVRCRRCCAPLTTEDRYYFISHCETCDTDIRHQAGEAHTPVKSPMYVMRGVFFILRRYRHIRTAGR
jgi:hypothetical protein